MERLWLGLAWLGIAHHLYVAAEEEVDEELVNMLLDSIVHLNDEATRMQKGSGEKRTGNCSSVVLSDHLLFALLPSTRGEAQKKLALQLLLCQRYCTLLTWVVESKDPFASEQMRNIFFSPFASTAHQ